MFERAQSCFPFAYAGSCFDRGKVSMQFILIPTWIELSLKKNPEFSSDLSGDRQFQLTKLNQRCECPWEESMSAAQVATNGQKPSLFLTYLSRNLSYGLFQDSFGNGRTRPTFLNSTFLGKTQYQRSYVPWKEGCPSHTFFLLAQIAVDLVRVDVGFFLCQSHEISSHF